MIPTRDDCLEMDARDPLAFARKRFVVPENTIYLDGNSLGALPAATPARVAQVIDREWGEGLIESWNRHDWISLPARLGALLAPLIGASPDEVIVADSTSVNLFKLAASAIRAQSPRRVILTERENFPTDLYVLQGLQAMLGGAIELKTVARDQLLPSLDDTVAVVTLTHVDYKTGEIHDMAAINTAAHATGALSLWDLSHSAGAIDVSLNRDSADLAIGCGYKYLNGGPGAPAYMFVSRALQPRLAQPLSGWMGHKAPFEFAESFRPADGMIRFLAGTPVVLGMAALEEGIKTFAGLEMTKIQEKAQALGDLFLALLEKHCGGHEFTIACPTSGQKRGSQISLRHPSGYAIMQALIAARVIGDFRAPDFMRFGFAPLYTRYADVWDAVSRLANIMRTEAWREGRFHRRAAVT